MVKMTGFTRRRHLRRVASAAAALILVVYVLWRPLKLVFQRRDQFSVHSDGCLSPKTRPPQIPKIIHQVYNLWSNGSLPDDWAANRQSCMRLNSAYEFNLWNKESAENLLETDYPWFLDTYHSYRYPIQRADAIRYFILHRHGGIYMDMDVGCVQNLDALLVYPAIMLAAPSIGLTNSIMGSIPGHAYVEKMTKSLTSYAINWVFPYLTIMNAAGPHFVSLVWIDYISGLGRWDGGRDVDKVHLIMRGNRTGDDITFFYEGRGSSWHNWDNRMFKAADRHPFVVVALVVPIIVIVHALLLSAWALWASRRRGPSGSFSPKESLKEQHGA